MYSAGKTQGASRDISLGMWMVVIPKATDDSPAE
jgi:hypothetical protein